MANTECNTSFSNTNDNINKVQLGDSTTNTNTTTTDKTISSGWRCPYTTPKAAQGWECPRCGRINAPWVSYCCCSKEYWYPTWNSDRTYIGDPPEWWKDYITCIQTDDITKNPNIYTVGGSDYRTIDGTYVNVGGAQSNFVDSHITARNHKKSNTSHYTIKEIK